jgi:Amidohydrolase
MAGLLDEMDRFYLREAVVSHWTGEEYDAASGNEALARSIHPRLLPAWSILPDDGFLEALANRRPSVVRINPAPARHNFSLARWQAGRMCEYLEQSQVVTLLSRSDIEWRELNELLENFPRLPLVLLDVGYRSDSYLIPLLKIFPSLHFDSAGYLAHRQLETFVERHGPERLLFGSRLPLFTPAAALGVLASARIPETDRLAVAGGNLRRLLNSVRK